MEIPKCINGNIAILVCISDDCYNPNPFICDTCKNNQCKLYHEDCMAISDWHHFRNRLEKSKHITHPDLISLSKTVQQTILKSIKSLERQFQYFKMWKSSIGMPAEAINLLKCIRENEEKKYNGADIASIIKSLKIKAIGQKLNEVFLPAKNLKQIQTKIQQINHLIRQLYQPQKMNNPFSERNKQKSKQQLNLKKYENILLPTKKVQKKQELTLKIKQFYIHDLNDKIMKLQVKPIHLELKCKSIYSQSCNYFINDSAYYSLFMSQDNTQNKIAVLNVKFKPVICFVNKPVHNLFYKEYHLYQNQASNCLNESAVIVLISKGTDLVQIIQHVNEIHNLSRCSPLLIQCNCYLTVFRLQIFDEQIYLDLYQFAESLRNFHLTSLKTITLYCPWNLGLNSSFIECERIICASLVELSSFQLFVIIVNKIQSMQGFKSLGNKVKTLIDQDWQNREQW